MKRILFFSFSFNVPLKFLRELYEQGFEAVIDGDRKQVLVFYNQEV